MQARPQPVVTEEVVRAAEPVLYGLAVRAVRNAAVARDLVQETYVAALEAGSRFQGRSSVRTWMAGILARKIVDHYRRTKREMVTAEPEEQAAPVRTFAPYAAGEADGRLDRRAALEVVERTLGQLTTLERLAVLLCDIEQVERGEVCMSLRVTPVHLRVLLHRGRHKLRKALEDAGMR
ncbi:MAG: RNA polymerase sigma factor [Proteobacteria bacterium]|nr:RNA polymerase sigma factor [Pseudomonadota bacterium]